MDRLVILHYARNVEIQGQGAPYGPALRKFPSSVSAHHFHVGCAPLYGIVTTLGGRIVTFAGGIPIKVGDAFVGAVGVSGGTADQGQAVARAAVEIQARYLSWKKQRSVKARRCVSRRSTSPTKATARRPLAGTSMSCSTTRAFPRAARSPICLWRTCGGKLKNWRRIATRYDKTADSYVGFVVSPQHCSGYPLSTWPSRMRSSRSRSRFRRFGSSGVGLTAIGSA